MSVTILVRNSVRQADRAMFETHVRTINKNTPDASLEKPGTVNNQRVLTAPEGYVYKKVIWAYKPSNGYTGAYVEASTGIISACVALVKCLYGYSFVLST